MAALIKPVSIHADSREKRSGIPAALSLIPEITLHQEEMDSGDYIVAPGVAVERKTGDDLVASIFDGRLFEQLAKMQHEHERVILLVEGDAYASRSAITPEAIDGALSYIALLSGAAFVHTPNAATTARMLHRMAVHLQHGLGYEIPMRVAKPVSAPSAIARYLVEGLPGVGPAMAKKLVAHFGTARAVFSASAEDLKAVKGVGDKTVKAITDALDRRGAPPAP